jgi:hypothetical protein
MDQANAVAMVMMVLAVGGLIVVLRPDRIEKELKGPWPLARKRLMDDEQMEALQRLQLRLPSMHVMSGVSLSRMLYVMPLGSAGDMRARSAYWARRKYSMSVDFAVCDAQGVIVAAVEMRCADDMKGGKARTQLEKQTMLKAAGVEFFSVSKSEPEEIATKIQEKAHVGRGVGRYSGGRSAGYLVGRDTAEEAA